MKRLIEADGAVSEYEMERIEQGLKRTEFLKDAVRALPEDAPSLAWRSALNQRIHAEADSRRKARRVALFLRPVLGLGLAGALTLAVFMKGADSVPQVTPTSRLEAEMVSAHQESVNSVMVAGRGLSAFEAKPTTVMPASHINWEESDLGDL